MPDVTRLLSELEEGDCRAAEKLLPLVYEELRRLASQRMAAERLDHTLQATALVHEAYLRLIDRPEQQSWNSRGHFFMAAAEAMRRILVENARRKARLRHGGAHQRIDFHQFDVADDPPNEFLLALDTALEQLQREEPHVAKVVQLRYFAALTIAETAAALNTSVRSTNRDWAYAKAWLHQRIYGPADADF